jgi:hypothetical protein
VVCHPEKTRFTRRMDVKTGKFTKKKMDSTVFGVLAKGEKRLYVS